MTEVLEKFLRSQRGIPETETIVEKVSGKPSPVIPAIPKPKAMARARPRPAAGAPVPGGPAIAETPPAPTPILKPTSLNKPLSQVTKEDMPRLIDIDTGVVDTIDRRASQIRTGGETPGEMEDLSRIRDFRANRMQIAQEISEGKRDLSELPGQPESEREREIEKLEAIKTRTGELPTIGSLDDITLDPERLGFTFAQGEQQGDTTRLLSLNEAAVQEANRPEWVKSLAKGVEVSKAVANRVVEDSIDFVYPFTERAVRKRQATNEAIKGAVDAAIQKGVEYMGDDPTLKMIWTEIAASPGAEAYMRTRRAGEQLVSQDYRVVLGKMLEEMAPENFGRPADYWHRPEPQSIMLSALEAGKKAGYPWWITPFLGAAGDLAIDPVIVGPSLAKYGYKAARGMINAAIRTGKRVAKETLPELFRIYKEAEEVVARGIAVEEAPRLAERGIARISRKPKLQEIREAIKPVPVEKPVAPLLTVGKTSGKKVLVTKVDKEVMQQFKSHKLSLPPDQQAEILKRMDAMGLGKRSVKTFGEMEQAAMEMGADIETVLKESGKVLTAEKAVALKNVINTNTRFIIDAEKRLLKAPDLAVTLNPEMARAGNDIDAALKQLIEGGTEAGRTVASFRIMARNTLDPDFWLRRAQRMLGNRDLTAEMQAGIRDLIDKKDLHGLSEFVAMLRNPSFGEKAITLWKAGLLTSPTTHLANITGNITMATLKSASDFVGTPIDMLIGVFTGKRTVTLPRLGAKIRGAVSAIPDAAKYIKTGHYDTALLTKWDIPQTRVFKNPLLHAYTESIFRGLGAEDIIFRKAALNETLEQQAILLAKNEGLRGLARRERIRELIMNPTNDMTRAMIDSAARDTFQNKNVIADMIQGAKRAAKSKGATGEVAAVGLEIVAPFTRTPTNIAGRILDFSPAGFIKAMINVARPTTRSQLQFVNDISRAITGSGMMAFGTYLASKGVLSGGRPKSPSERAQWQAEGKKAYSIKIGGRWYRLDRISPAGNIITLGADLYETQKEKEGLALVSEVTGKAAKALTEQTFLRGVSGGLKAITEPERFAERFTEQTIASTIPSIIGRVARTFDPIIRDPEGVVQSIQARLPFLTEMLPARRDLFGREVLTSGGRLNLIDPFASSQVKEHPVIREAVRLEANIGRIGIAQYGMKMDNYEYSKYQEIYGRVREAAMLALIKSDEYDNADDEAKLKMFEGSDRKVKEIARKNLFPMLMAERYNLPDGTELWKIRKLLTESGRSDEFKKMTIAEQAALFKKLLAAPSAWEAQ